eukprot:scaffold31464_cov31-Tisochrysis_lutea.AAC.1
MRGCAVERRVATSCVVHDVVPEGFPPTGKKRWYRVGELSGEYEQSAVYEKEVPVGAGEGVCVGPDHHHTK